MQSTTKSLVCLSLWLLLAAVDAADTEYGQDMHWDLLIFSQSWPETTCYSWREKNENQACYLPTKSEFWTIHGIWPTRMNTIGPSFCNKSAEFDMDKLKPIVTDLNTFWPDIKTKTEVNPFWKHEYLKHGTCAAVVEELNSELKYFDQGLDWRGSYVISSILGAAGIHPDSEHQVINFHLAIKNALGKNPIIHCLYDHKKDIDFIAEIRICFNKSLDIENCDGVAEYGYTAIDYPGGVVSTNCHLSRPIRYPSSVPTRKRQASTSWAKQFVNMYKLVNFLMWLTI